jgi:predicted small lipoprotein YifL
MKTKPGLLIAFFLCLFVTAACGQKGPLFLPGSPSTITTTVTEQQSIPDEDTDDEEEEEQQSNNIN